MKFWSAFTIALLPCAAANAQFVNESQTPGALLSKSYPELGRLTTIEVLGDYVIAIPEAPSAPPEADNIVRVLDISDPTNPTSIMELGETAHPVLAHGTFKRGNEVYLGGWPNDTVRLDENGSLVHTTWSGPEIYWDHGAMFYPWGAKHWWSYGDIDGQAWITLNGAGPDDALVEWDHLGLTGVIGFPTFLGNLLIYASDQSMSGIATYDVSDPTNPVLLDTFNLPTLHPEYSNWDGSIALPWGLGGYWSAVHSHYMVWARRGDNPGVQVVDFSDPANLQLHCEIFFEDPALGIPNESTLNPMYPNFQDEFIFAERLKINIETCEVELILDELGEFVETAQYSRPIGNLLLTGGGSNYIFEGLGETEGGLGIWAHQAEPDTRPPYVAYHIPQDGQTNYPTNLPYSLMIPETLHATTIIPGETLILEKVGGEEVPIDYLLNHTGMLTVRALEELDENATYRMTLVDIEDAVHNKMEEYSFTFSTGSEVSNQPPIISSVAISPTTTAEIEETISVTVEATDPENSNLEFRYRFASDQDYSNWTTSNQASTSYTTAGTYTISIQVRDELEATVAATETILIQEQDTAPIIASVSSAPLALTADGSELWVTNPDNSTLAAITLPDMTLAREIRVGNKPKSVAIDHEGNIWVVHQRDDDIAIFDSAGTLLENIEFDHGAAPTAIVIDNTSNKAYVALHGSGAIVKIDTELKTITDSISELPSVYALSLSSTNNQLLATRFVSPQHWGEVWAINSENLALSATIILEQSVTEDDIDDGSGIPNYLSHITIDSSARYAYVVGKKDNINRGLLNTNNPLDDDNTVRTFMAVIDLATYAELKDRRLDFDNADSPSSILLSPLENYLFVTLQGNNQTVVIDLDASAGQLGSQVTNIPVGLAPQGMALDSENLFLYVKNTNDRSVSQIDLSAFVTGSIANPPTTAIATIRRDRMNSTVLKGKQIFYNASYGLDEDGEFTGRMSAEGYISCATCHFDGDQDGRVYDFTARGEGLRNNLSLLGRQGDSLGNLHWSGNFDEVQDFELDMRHRFLGRGLMADDDFIATEHPLESSKAGLSEDLDALAAFVNSLNRSTVPQSPYRNSDGSMTASAELGQTLFNDLDCGSCHSRSVFSDGQIHDVGTLREYSGFRLSEPLAGLRTPSLIGLFNSAPYLHDGSASTIEEIFQTVGGEVVQAEFLLSSGNTEQILADGFSFLREGAGVRLGRFGTLSWEQESSVERTGFIRVRYGSVATSTEMILSVNGTEYNQNLELLPRVEGKDTSFAEARFAVELLAGTNEIALSIQPNVRGETVIIDDITISTEEAEIAAQPHLVFNDLTQENKEHLLNFLRQIEYGGNSRARAPNTAAR